IYERPVDAYPECIASPTSLTPTLGPEPEEHAGHDGHEREPHQREAHAHQIGQCALKNAIDASRRPGLRSDVPAGYLVRLVLEQAFESHPSLLAGLSGVALPLDRRLPVVRGRIRLVGTLVS